MPHVDIEIENEIRASVDEFVEGMRALVRKAVLQSVARHLQVDVSAAQGPANVESRPMPAGISSKPAATPMETPRKRPAERAPERPAAARPPTRSAPRGPERKKRSAPRVAERAGASRRTAAPKRPIGESARSAELGGSAQSRPTAQGPAEAASRAIAEQGPAEAGSRPMAERGAETSSQPASASASASPAHAAFVDETASTLLAHVEIEPGQGIEDLALAMGTPAADLDEPIKKLLAENKITEELRQGQVTYYPT